MYLFSSSSTYRLRVCARRSAICFQVKGKLAQLPSQKEELEIREETKTGGAADENVFSLMLVREEREEAEQKY